MSLLLTGPAKASIICCDASEVVAEYVTGGGNVHTAYAHLRIEDDGSGDARARLHWHCRRNGDPFDGCRADGYLVLQRWTGAAWVDWSGQVYCHSPVSGTGWFQDSGEFYSAFKHGPSFLVRARIYSGNVRFLLGDGSNVLVPAFDAVSQTWRVTGA
jgi:hypothetical protein